MQEVVGAIAEQRWGVALVQALERWRETRAPQVGRLIELLGARVGVPTTETGWREPYDPERVTPLVTRIAVGMRSSDDAWSAVRERWAATPLVAALDREPAMPQQRNWLERVFALLSWPDDPRIAPVLADWLTTPEPLVRSPAFDIVFGAIADRLVALDDARVIPQLDAFLEDHDGGYRDQRGLVERVRAALVMRSDDDLEVAAAVARLEEADGEITSLWKGVAERAADRDARSVLGDALAAAGDPRGELFGLQSASEGGGDDPRRGKRIARLVDTHWEQWLGSALASLIVRDGSELRRGMLEVIRVGYPTTPPRAWRLARGHRELAAVHTILVGRVPPVAYAELVVTLPHLVTLEVDHPETLQALARIARPLVIETLIYRRVAQPIGVWPNTAASFRELAAVAPQLQRVAIDPPIRED
ncbi:MAG TPA: hypothetical protein VK427_03365 [Kofleriaceae bacterium]|nr:hypothetical protein [Kofleriaceae bacterium]